MKRSLARWLPFLPVVLLAAAMFPAYPASANGVGTVYVGCTAGNAVSVIDTNTNTMVEDIPLDQPPLSLAFSPDAHFVYVSHPGSNLISVIETPVEDVTATMKVGSQVADITVTSSGAWLLATDPQEGKLRVIDPSLKKELFSIPVAGADWLDALPDGSLAYVAASQSGAISTVDLQKRAVIATVDAGPGNHYPTVSPTGDQVAVTSSEGDKLLILNAATGQITRTIAVGPASGGAAFSPTGDLVYVPRADKNEVTIINVATGAIAGSISLPGHPAALGVSKDGNRAFIALQDRDSVAVADLAKKAVALEVKVDKGPTSIAMSPIQPRIVGVPMPTNLPNTGDAGTPEGSSLILAAIGALLLTTGAALRLFAFRRSR